LAVITQSNNSVVVLLNTTPTGAAAASFAPGQSFSVGSLPQAIAVGDVNGDGKPDLAVANTYSDTVSVLLNTNPAGASPPSFAPQQAVRVGRRPVGVALGDVNGDGRPDLASANSADDSVTVRLNTTPAGATTVVFATAQAAITGAGTPTGVTFADLNGDGKPDLAASE